MKKNLCLAYLKVFISFTFLIASSHSVFAQKTSTPKPVSSDHIQVFDNAKYFGQNNLTPVFNNVIKINPLVIANGDLPVYFEHKFAARMSFEAALGLTLENYLDLRKLFSDNNENRDKDSKTDLGYSLRGALRYYPSQSDEALIGIYFAPEVQYRVYNRTSPFHDTDNGSKIIDGKNADTYTKSIDFKLVFGGQDDYDNNITYEYYIGVGIRRRTDKYLEIKSINNPGFGGPYYTNEEKTETTISPVISLGFKLGFGF